MPSKLETFVVSLNIRTIMDDDDCRTETGPFQIPAPCWKELKVIEARGLKILEYERKVKYWQKRLDEVLEQQDRCCRLIRIRIDAKCYWDCIYHKEQSEKDFLLAALLLQSKTLPVELERFSVDINFPPHIRSDKEILYTSLLR